MAVKGKKKNILIPDGMVRDIEEIVESSQSWISLQEFIRQAIAEKIDRWKKENPEKG